MLQVLSRRDEMQYIYAPSRESILKVLFLAKKLQFITSTTIRSALRRLHLLFFSLEVCKETYLNKFCTNMFLKLPMFTYSFLQIMH